MAGLRYTSLFFRDIDSNYTVERESYWTRAGRALAADDLRNDFPCGQHAPSTTGSSAWTSRFRGSRHLASSCRSLNVIQMETRIASRSLRGTVSCNLASWKKLDDLRCEMRRQCCPIIRNHPPRRELRALAPFAEVSTHESIRHTAGLPKGRPAGWLADSSHKRNPIA